MSAPLDPSVADDVEGPDPVEGTDVVESARAQDGAAVAPPRAAPPQPWSWHALRVSGLFLAALLVWHVVVTFVLTDVGQTTAVTVSDHWHDATWRALEWVTLVLALGHGGLGLDALLRRAPWAPGVRTATRVAGAAVVASLAVAASVVVLTYR